MRVITVLAVVLAASLSIGGCATQATSQSMTVPATVSSVRANSKLKGLISVSEVRGGKDTNPLWLSQVSNDGFKQALEQSLALTGYLAKSGEAKFNLDAELVSLDQPVFGLSFDVTSSVTYRLISSSEIKTIPVVAVGTATFSDSWVGVERMRIANEKSIQKNIQELINALGKH